jgi:hypothetical protein
MLRQGGILLRLRCARNLILYRQKRKISRTYEHIFREPFYRRCLISTGDGTRTHDLRIMRPPQPAREPLENKPETSNKQTLAPFRIHDDCKTDPVLAEIVDAWTILPEAIKAGVLAMVRATLKRGDAE